MAGERQLSDGNDAGTILGQSTSDLVSLHGVTPIARALVAALTSGTLGDTNTAVNAIITALHNKGITRTS